MIAATTCPSDSGLRAGAGGSDEIRGGNFSSGLGLMKQGLSKRNKWRGDGNLAGTVAGQ